MELLDLIQEADVVAIAMERARESVEAAKLALENAKEAHEAARARFEQTLAKADEIGVPRAKIKKLVEERTATLIASGLIGLNESAPKAPRPPKAPKKKANEESLAPVETVELEAVELEAAH